MVTIICPRTGQRVSTGLTMTEEEFARAPLAPNVLRCPACGRVHQWSKRDAELQPDAPQSPPGPPRK